MIEYSGDDCNFKRNIIIIKMLENFLVTWYSRVIFITLNIDLRSVSRADFQRLSIMRKSCRVFHDRSLLGRCFRCYVLPVLEYRSAVWCSAADTHLKLLDRAVNGSRFLTGDVFEWDILIVDPWQYCVCCIRSGVIRCTLLMASAGYSQCSDRTSVHLSAA